MHTKWTEFEERMLRSEIICYLYGSKKLSYHIKYLQNNTLSKRTYFSIRSKFQRMMEEVVNEKMYEPSSMRNKSNRRIYKFY